MKRSRAWSRGEIIWFLPWTFVSALNILLSACWVLLSTTITALGFVAAGINKRRRAK